MVGRYTHAHQFKRARRQLKFLRIRLGRVIRDIHRKIAGNEALEARFADLLARAMRVRFQDHRQRGPKVYALHAPEVECIGKARLGQPDGISPSRMAEMLEVDKAGPKVRC
jgi:transposase, IS5 family